jgi:hypothetical protein
MSDDAESFDGIYFLPFVKKGEELGLTISYFNFNTKALHEAPPIENTNFGDKYYIAFFKRDDDGNAAFDDSFEAILGEPDTYIKNLAGAGVYGCIVRKTAKSGKWFKNYLKRTIKDVTMNRLINTTKSVLNSKQ